MHESVEAKFELVAKVIELESSLEMFTSSRLQKFATNTIYNTRFPNLQTFNFSYRIKYRIGSDQGENLNRMAV